MKFVELPKAGQANVFQVKEASSPKLSEHDVRIEVHYSGINFADIHMRQGLYQDAPAFPFTPGYEVAGIIKEVGTKVESHTVGDPVCAGTLFGGYSSEVTVSQWQAIKLNSTDDEELQRGASLPVSFMTAYLCLFETLKVRTNEVLFIDCATGALGQMAMQLLKGQNLTIYGLTSSPQKKAALEAAGVKAIVGGYNDIPKVLKFDAVINSKGGQSVHMIQKHLNPLGRQVLIGASDMIRPKKANLINVIGTWWKMRRLDTISMINENVGFFGLNVLNLFKQERLVEKYFNHMAAFELDSIVDRAFDFSEVAAAHEYLESRKSKGKVLLKWNKK